MKKYLAIVALSALIIGTFNSCNKGDLETFAEIAVIESGQAQSSVAVYMFDDNTSPNSAFFEPFYGDKTVVTDLNGVATFSLNQPFDLSIVDPQTTLYFGVFDANDSILGHTALTIEQGETKTAIISY